MIQRHGIYNPTQVVVPSRASCYMAPHNVRDVLAAHILQQTGSYEQASRCLSTHGMRKMNLVQWASTSAASIEGSIYESIILSVCYDFCRHILICQGKMLNCARSSIAYIMSKG